MEVPPRGACRLHSATALPPSGLEVRLGQLRPAVTGDGARLNRIGQGGAASSSAHFLTDALRIPSVGTGLVFLSLFSFHMFMKTIDICCLMVN